MWLWSGDVYEIAIRIYIDQSECVLAHNKFKRDNNNKAKDEIKIISLFSTKIMLYINLMMHGSGNEQRKI